MTPLRPSLTAVLLAGLLIAPNAGAQPDEPQADMLIENDVLVTTRAGFEIAVNVYRPNKTGQFPVILSMGPYGKDDLPAEYGGLFDSGQIVVSEYAAFETPDPEYWVHYDYVVIAADSAGSGNSGGDHELFGPIEMEAFYDVIEWAGVQPWSNGNVGLNGESYFGVSQWFVAALKPPHLKAIVPGEALIDVYRDAARHGGIPSDFTIAWMTYRIRPALAPGAQLRRDLAAALDEHPLIDDYWSSMVPDLSAIDVPAYVIASWPDHGLHTRGTLIGYEQIGSENKWLEIHGRKKWEYYYSRDSLERQRRFFDQYLKDNDRGMASVPAVRYERRNAFYDGEIRFADDWPLPGTEAHSLFLTPDGGLADESLPDAAALRYDAEDASAQLRFSHRFTADTEITGTANLRVWVEAAGADDMDLYVGLSKLDRDGNEVFMAGYNDVEDGHVASGWLRVSYRELDTDRSTELHPFLHHRRVLPLTPSERVEVQIEILPSSTMFRAGESLVLRLQGTELPGAGGITHINGVNAGDHIVHVGGAMPSRLILPVIPQ